VKRASMPSPAGLVPAEGGLTTTRASFQTCTHRHKAGGEARRRRARRGISLLEVLIAIGVLSIGLLSVAAVIPVARHEMIEAAKADRGSACGQAALHDVKVRGALNPADWRGFDGAGWTAIGAKRPPPSGTTPLYHDARRGFEFGESYAVDPLYVAEATKVTGVSSTHLADFPYNPSSPGARVVAGLPLQTRWTRMQRVTWSRVGLDVLLAQSVFRWHDDVLFPVPADETQRPEQFLRVVNQPSGQVQPLQAEFDGNYSWLVTVTPLPQHIDFPAEDPYNPGTTMPYSYSENSPLYTVSVAVFYKRDMTPPNGFVAEETPGERQVRLEFLGGGLGGGDVCLYLFPSDAGRPEYLDIRENEWLLVSGGYARTCYFYNDVTLNPPASSSGTVPVGVHKWYRVVATGEIVVEDTNGNGALDADEDMNANGILDPPYRDATLAGPDWNVANWGVDVNADGNPNEALAGLFKGVVGVYSTDMELDW